MLFVKLLTLLYFILTSYSMQDTTRISWSIADFKVFVEAVRPLDVASAAASAAHAVARDIQFSAFHAQRSLRAVSEVQLTLAPGEGPLGMRAMHQLFREAEPGERERPLRLANFEASAHLLASLRSLHAATDLLAPVIYFGLALGERLTKPIPEASLYPANVRDGLISSSIFTPVAEALNALLALPAYRFLRAFVNTTKHQQMVKAGFTISIDFSDDPRHGVEIGRFSYKGETYGPTWAAEFFGSSYGSINERVISVGCAVNDMLRAEYESHGVIA